MKSSREQFEEWIKAERPKLFLDLLETYPTRYSDPATERLWQSWQASREALANEEVTTAPFLKVD